MKQKQQAKLYWFNKCNMRVAAERATRAIFMQMMAAHAAGGNLNTAPRQ